MSSMPHTRTSKKKDVQIATYEAIEQERDVLKLRHTGMSYAKIAVELNLSGPGQANKIFHRAMERHTEELAPDIRRLESARLDELQEAIWDMAMAGDLKAVETVLRVMERRAKLCGLDHTDKMAAQQLKIEANKIQIMAIALGRALDALRLTEEQKMEAQQVMFTEMKVLSAK